MWESRTHTRMEYVVWHNMELKELFESLFACWREEPETKTSWEPFECPVVGREQGDDWTTTFSLGEGLFPTPLEGIVQSYFLQGGGLVESKLCTWTTKSLTKVENSSRRNSSSKMEGGGISG